VRCDGRIGGADCERETEVETEAAASAGGRFWISCCKCGCSDGRTSRNESRSDSSGTHGSAAE
jgi:hypothetical protein